MISVPISEKNIMFSSKLIIALTLTMKNSSSGVILSTGFSSIARTVGLEWHEWRQRLKCSCVKKYSYFMAPSAGWLGTISLEKHVKYWNIFFLEFNDWYNTQTWMYLHPFEATLHWWLPTVDLAYSVRSPFLAIDDKHWHLGLSIKVCNWSISCLTFYCAR